MYDDPDNKDTSGDDGIRPIASITYGVGTLVRQCLALLGAFLIPIGVIVAFLTPLIPIGLPIGILGVFLLGRYSVWGRQWMEGVLERHPSIERFAPNWLMKLVFSREKRSGSDRT